MIMLCSDNLFPWVMANYQNESFLMSKYDFLAWHWLSMLIVKQFDVGMTKGLFSLRKTWDSREPLHNESDASADFRTSSGNGKYIWKSKTNCCSLCHFCKGTEQKLSLHSEVKPSWQ